MCPARGNNLLIKCRKRLFRENRTPQNQKIRQNHFTEEEAGYVLNLQGEVASLQGARGPVQTLPHLMFDIKKGKYVPTPIPRHAQMKISVSLDYEPVQQLVRGG